MSERDVKRHLRAAHRADSEAFDRLVREYLEHGDAAFAAAKRGTNAGRPPELNDDIRSLFLASVLNRIDDGVSQNAALREVAERADFWGVFKRPLENPEKPKAESNYARHGTFDNYNTARSHFRSLRQRYDEDPEFRERVDFHRWALKLLD